MSQLFASRGQSIGASASSSVLPINIQSRFPLGLTGWISLQSKWLSRVFSSTTIQSINSSALSLLYSPTLTPIHTKCQVTSVVSDSVRPHRWQPTRLPHPWDSPGKNTGVGYHFLLQCMKVKSESEVTQSCPTPSNPMDCSLPGSSTHGIFQARVLEWGAIAFSNKQKMAYLCYISWGIAWRTKWLQNNKNI